MLRPLLAVSLLLACLSTASRAVAGPGIWAVARQPQLRAQAQLLEEVDDLLLQYRRAGSHDALFVARTIVLRDALAQLTKLGAAHSADPAIRYRLGRVLFSLWDVDQNRSYLERAANMLHSVTVSRAPRLMRADALNDYALCLARLGRIPEELRAYGDAIALDPHPESQPILRGNRAEGFMLTGDLETAVSEYRASLALTPTYAMSALGVTTMWGLAVALDRSGDLNSALERIRTARSLDPSDERINSPSWFYLPDHDRHWYEALGHWQRARHAPPAERLDAALAAIESWEAYIYNAPTTDRWLPLAAQRQRRCEIERDRLRTRFAPEAPPGSASVPKP